MESFRRLRLGLALAVSAVVVWSLAPFLWQVVTSLKSPQELVVSPPVYWPARPSLASYARVFKTRPFARYIANSVVVSLGATLLCVLLSSMAAYAFTRLTLPGGRWAARAILLLTVFPCTLIIVPLYRLFQMAHLLNRPLGLIVPYAALNLPFAIWVLMAFFRRIPREVEEAACVDGLSRWGILWRIVFPLSAPAIATTAILVFICSWNEFLIALIFMSQDSARTVPVGIAMLSGATIYEVPWDQITAAVVVTTLPVVAMVAACQRRILESLTAGAVKG